MYSERPARFTRERDRGEGMTNEDLKLIQSIGDDTQWLRIEHGVACGLNPMIVIVAMREQIVSMATELLDARARIERIGKEVNE